MGLALGVQLVASAALAAIIIILAEPLARTLLHYAGGRKKKAYLMAMLDPASAWVPGWSVGPSANQDLAFRCRRAARQHLDDGAGMVVHSD